MSVIPALELGKMKEVGQINGETEGRGSGVEQT